MLGNLVCKHYMNWSSWSISHAISDHTIILRRKVWAPHTSVFHLLEAIYQVMQPKRIGISIVNYVCNDFASCVVQSMVARNGQSIVLCMYEKTYIVFASNGASLIRRAIIDHYDFVIWIL